MSQSKMTTETVVKDGIKKANGKVKKQSPSVVVLIKPQIVCLDFKM